MIKKKNILIGINNVLSTLKAGDFVIMQFGHNDQ
mgnify:CR=1 FL=1